MITTKDMFKRLTKDVFGIWNIANDKEKPDDVGRTFFNDHKEWDIPFNSKNNGKLLSIYRFVFEHKMYLSARDISKNLNMVLKDIFSCDFSYLIFDDYDEPEVDEDKRRYWLLIIEALLDSVINKEQFKPDKQIFSTTDISARRTILKETSGYSPDQKEHMIKTAVKQFSKEDPGEYLFFLTSLFSSTELIKSIIGFYIQKSRYEKEKIEYYPTFLDYTDKIKKHYETKILNGEVIIKKKNQSLFEGYSVDRSKMLLESGKTTQIIIGDLDLYSRFLPIHPNIKMIILYPQDMIMMSKGSNTSFTDLIHYSETIRQIYDNNLANVFTIEWGESKGLNMYYISGIIDTIRTIQHVTAIRKYHLKRLFDILCACIDQKAWDEQGEDDEE